MSAALSTSAGSTTLKLWALVACATTAGWAKRADRVVVPEHPDTTNSVTSDVADWHGESG